MPMLFYEIPLRGSEVWGQVPRDGRDCAVGRALSDAGFGVQFADVGEKATIRRRWMRESLYRRNIRKLP